jgi:hypothetical protein
LSEWLTFEEIFEKGVMEGELWVARRFLLRQGRKKFGPPGPHVEPTIEAINDLERLRRMAERLLTVTIWDELLATS